MIYHNDRNDYNKRKVERNLAGGKDDNYKPTHNTTPVSLPRAKSRASPREKGFSEQDQSSKVASEIDLADIIGQTGLDGEASEKFDEDDVAFIIKSLQHHTGADDDVGVEDGEDGGRDDADEDDKDDDALVVRLNNGQIVEKECNIFTHENGSAAGSDDEIGAYGGSTLKDASEEREDEEATTALRPVTKPRVARRMKIQARRS